MYNRLSSNREGSTCDGLKKVYTGGHVCLSEVPKLAFMTADAQAARETYCLSVQLQHLCWRWPRKVCSHKCLDVTFEAESVCVCVPLFLLCKGFVPQLYLEVFAPCR